MTDEGRQGKDDGKILPETEKVRGATPKGRTGGSGATFFRKVVVKRPRRATYRCESPKLRAEPRADLPRKLDRMSRRYGSKVRGTRENRGQSGRLGQAEPPKCAGTRKTFPSFPAFFAGAAFGRYRSPSVLALLRRPRPADSPQRVCRSRPIRSLRDALAHRPVRELLRLARRVAVDLRRA